MITNIKPVHLFNFKKQNEEKHNINIKKAIKLGASQQNEEKPNGIKETTKLEQPHYKEEKQTNKNKPNLQKSQNNAESKEYGYFSPYWFLSILSENQIPIALETLEYIKSLDKIKYIKNNDSL